MSELIWKDSFDTGIAEIDRQHRRFLDYLNRCTEYSLSHAREKVVPELIVKMREYALMHFEFEEALMRSAGYAGYEQHEGQHAFFNARVAELEEAITGGVNEKAVSLAAFMRDWLISHILEEDKRYTPLLARQTTPSGDR